jgi:hypothetical protein
MLIEREYVVEATEMLDDPMMHGERGRERGNLTAIMHHSSKQLTTILKSIIE